MWFISDFVKIYFNQIFCTKSIPLRYLYLARGAAKAALQLFLAWKNDPSPSFIIFSHLSPQFINKQNCQFINKSCAVLPPNAQNEKQFVTAVKNICAMIIRVRKTGSKTKDIKFFYHINI